MNRIWLGLGWVSFILGVIGIFLPILPTTPFILLAAFLFSKGSPRIHQWLLSQPTFGPMIRDWEENRVIRPRAKWVATIALIASNAWVWVWVERAPWVGKAVMSLVCLSVLVFIWRCPSEIRGAERMVARH